MKSFFCKMTQLFKQRATSDILLSSSKEALAMLYPVAMNYKWIVMIVLLGPWATGTSQAATWYVATNGANNTSCGSTSSPCATVSYILGNKVSAGDTIKIKAGIYTNQEGINLNNTTKHNNVTITADDVANRPQLLNSSINVGSGVSGATISYLRIRMLASPGDIYAGVVDVSGYPTIIDNNELWNGGQGVFIRTSKQVTVSNNHIHDLGSPGSDYDNMCVLITNWEKTPAATSYAEAIRITGNELGPNCSGDGMQENSAQGPFPFAYLILDNNKCHDNQEQCFDFKGTQYVKIYNNDIYKNGYGGISDNSAYGGTPNFEIYNNKIHDHTNYAIATQGSGSAWKIYNNLIYNNVSDPEYNYSAIQPPQDSNTVIYNNTIVNNSNSTSRQSGGIIAGGATIKNNIFYNNGLGSGDYGNINGTGGIVSHNYVYPTSPGSVGQNAITNCYQIGNCPGFVSINTYDFRLLASSPAVNKGTNLGSPYNIDYFSIARPQNDAYDIGAYEYVMSVMPPPVNPDTLKSPSNLRILQ